MPPTHQRDVLQKLRVLLCFNEFNILIFIMIYRKNRKNLNSRSAPVLQPAPSPQPQPLPRSRRKPQNSWVMPLIFQREEGEFYRTLLADLEEVIPNVRKPLEVGLKLAITLRHLATGKIYRTLQYHWLVVPDIC